MAAPILNARQEAVAAVSVAGPVARITRDEVAVFGAAVRQAAEAISSRMGFFTKRSNETQTVPSIRSK